MSSTTPPGPGGPEYLDVSSSPAPADPSAGRTTRGRFPVLGAAALGVVAVVGLGGWAAMSYLSGGGDQPAAAVPASALGYVSVDLDPSAPQKIEAFKILRKFPGLDKQLDLGSRDDVRRWIFEDALLTGDCKSLDYATDVEPWLGDRVAVAAVPAAGGAKVAPLVALQVTDQQAADKGLAALVDCSGSAKDTGYAFADGYALISTSDQQAQAFATAAGEASLADDQAFQDWTGRVGDPGIITMYAAEAAKDHVGDLAKAMGGGMASAVSPMAGAPQSELDAATRQMQEMYADFSGAAGVIRFADGSVEAEFAGKGMSKAAPIGDTTLAVGDLPATTAGAFSVALPDGWLQSYVDSISGMFGAGETSDDLLRQAERETGLKLPEDIETLLGDAVSVAVDSSLDVKSVEQSGDLSTIPAGVLVQGDPSAIMPVVDKVRKALGPDGDMLVAKAGDGKVAFGVDPSYVDSLLGAGGLGKAPAFAKVLPDADKAGAAFYLDFDAGDGWADRLADSLSDGDPQVVANIRPLDALGASSWLDGDGVQHGVFRLSTD